MLRNCVIGEGVETVEQLKLMQQIGCDQVQGFYLGRPTSNPDHYLSGYDKSLPAATLPAELHPGTNPAG